MNGQRIGYKRVPVFRAGELPELRFGDPKRRMLFVIDGSNPNSRAAARRLIPSIQTARRTLAYSSTVFIPPVSHRKHNSYVLRIGLGTKREPACL